jgi:flagellar basal-body rod modification protein FlgD
MTVSGTAAAWATKESQTQDTSQKPTNSLASKDTFLQLLVAQMRNQDPLQPTDGVQFLSQLAQFSNLEQSIQIDQDVVAVREAIDTLTDLIKEANQNGETKP